MGAHTVCSHVLLLAGAVIHSVYEGWALQAPLCCPNSYCPRSIAGIIFTVFSRWSSLAHRAPTAAVGRENASQR